jgi:ADP-ribose pyrophosphatase YjhB (NUDIX family)
VTAPAPHDDFAYCPRCSATLTLEDGARPHCLACGFVHWLDPKLATGVVASRDGRILLVRRGHEPAYGRWSFPSGFVDRGEPVEEAAAREALEEAGVRVRIDRLLGVFSTAGDPVVFVAFAATIVDGEPAAGDEALEVGLFAPDALPELAFPHDGAIVEAWRAGLGDAHAAAMARSTVEEAP